MEGADCANIRIARSFSREERHFDTFQIALRDKITILEALEHIYENVDSTLSFRQYCCGVQYCNSCLILVNGRLAHACLTMVEAKEYVLEPRPNYPVVKDLAVDLGGGDIPNKRAGGDR